MRLQNKTKQRTVNNTRTYICNTHDIAAAAAAAAATTTTKAIVGSIYSLTPNKLLQKVFQRIWGVFDIITNILKVPQNPTSGKLLFSKWRPRWPP